MEYKIVWVPLAVETYMEEIDFIFLKCYLSDRSSRSLQHLTLLMVVYIPTVYSGSPYLTNPNLAYDIVAK